MKVTGNTEQALQNFYTRFLKNIFYFTILGTIIFEKWSHKRSVI